MYYQKLSIPVDQHHVDVLYYKAKSANRPIIFEMHGGGFMFGSATSDAIMCHRLRNELDVNVASIEYTLTTKAPYPTQLNEVYETMLHFYQHADEYQINPDKMITLGHSAGANLATTVCMKANETQAFKVCLQVMDYPYLDLVSDSYEKEQLSGSIGPKFMEMFKERYAGDQDPSSPFISPIKASDEQLQQLPPAVIVLAEYDGLKYEGLTYANQLIKNCVETHVKTVKKAPHAFMEKYFSASRVVRTKYKEEQAFVWIKGHLQYYMNREF